MIPSDDAQAGLPPELPSNKVQSDGLTQQLATALNAEDERRLHPLSWVYGILSGLKAAIIPILFLWFSNDSFGDLGRFLVFIAAGLLTLVVITSVIKYLTYRFVIQAGEIRVRWGVINKQVRHIPLNKIHNISLQRDMLHRLMGVAQVRLESAGSGQESEAVFSVLSYADALLLEQAIEQGARQQSGVDANNGADIYAKTNSNQTMFHVKHNIGDKLYTSHYQHLMNQSKQPSPFTQSPFTQRSAPQSPASLSSASGKNTTLLTLNHRDIIRYGLISNTGLALGGVLTFISNPEVIFLWLKQTLLPNPDVAMAWGFLLWLGLSIVALCSFVILAKGISIISAYLSLYQFSLQDNSQYVTIEQGLFTRHKSRMPLDKVQVWRIEETWLHRLFKRQRLLVDSAILKGKEDNERGINELIPIATPTETQTLLKRWEGVEASAFDFMPVHPKAWRRLWFAYSIRFSLLLIPIITIALVSGVFNTVMTNLTNSMLDIQTEGAGIGLILPLSLMSIIWLILVIFMGIYAKKRAKFMGVAIGVMPTNDNSNQVDSSQDVDSQDHSSKHNSAKEDSAKSFKHWLIWRDGWLTKKWIICEVPHCHGLQINQSPFDRRYDMATLTVDTVGGTLLNARLNLLYLPINKARQLQLYIRQQVG